jgi:lipopolysaccharide/colanic/teichoic acid biosynthesis glycosyltransferase
MSLMPITYNPKRPDSQLHPVSVPAHQIFNEPAFKRMIAIERKRTERSDEAFLLILFDANRHSQNPDKAESALNNVASTLLSSIRDTDVIGWHKARTTLGLVCTGLPITDNDSNSLSSAILNRVTTMLRGTLGAEQFREITISFHLFPDDWDHNDSGDTSDQTLYPDLTNLSAGRRSALIMKRAIDIIGSGLILTLSAPLLLVIALAIKVSSRGPILFRQERVGQYGKKFTFLKFRSMLLNNDESIHKEFVTKFITEQAQHQALNENCKRPYKLAADKRITRVGRILRSTSMDELPQLLNVLRGDMSLVGPRPPIPYEVAVYETWHRRRVLESKPGITGLWQVTGRSSVKFDEMVRLDLRYSASWTPWLDLWILLRTPLAVIKGTG